MNELESGKIINHSISHRIFLVLHKNNLSCLITDKNRVPLLYEEFDWLDEGLLKRQISQRSYFQEIYSSSRLILSEPKFSLIPAEFHLSEEEYKLLFKMNHRLKEDEILVDIEVDNHIKVICSPYEELFKHLSKLFPGIRVVHQLNYILKDHRLTQIKGDHLLISLKGDDLLIVAKKDLNLQLANSFSAKNPEEIKYFVMLVTEQLGFANEHTILGILSSDLDVTLKIWFQDYFQTILEFGAEDVVLDFLNAQEKELFASANALHAALICE